MIKDAKWVLAAINGCNDTFQLDCCRTLIALFIAKHPLESAMEADNLLDRLRNKEIEISVTA